MREEMIETTVLHPESETEIISPLSRKGAASGEFQRRKKTRVAVLAGRVARVQAGENLAEVALELGVDRRGLARWQERLDPEMLRTDRRREKGLEREVEELKKALAEKVLEVDFLRGALHKVEARRRQSESAGVAESTTKSRK